MAINSTIIKQSTARESPGSGLITVLIYIVHCVAYNQMMIGRLAAKPRQTIERELARSGLQKLEQANKLRSFSGKLTSALKRCTVGTRQGVRMPNATVTPVEGAALAMNPSGLVSRSGTEVSRRSLPPRGISVQSATGQCYHTSGSGLCTDAEMASDKHLGWSRNRAAHVEPHPPTPALQPAKAVSVPPPLFDEACILPEGF